MLDPNNPHDIASLEKCRNIISEIVNFGVNDKEIYKIIELISLELEDTDLMRQIHSVIKPEREIKEVKEKLII